MNLPDFQKSSELESPNECPLCAGTALRAAPIQPNPPFGLQQCSKCNIIFLSPRPPANAMSQYYTEFYESDGNFQKSSRQDNRARRHFRRLRQAAVRPGRLLEVGAGDGYFLKVAQDEGWEIEGLELSRPRIERARTWFDINLKCGDLSDMPFPAASFDAIVMFQLIEHVHHPQDLLKRVYELLRPQGIMMLSTPNVLAYARKGREVNSWRIPRHLFFFTPLTLVRTVENIGFEVLRKPLKFYATLEERLGWQPWPSAGPFSRVTRDLWTPFGLHLLARKT